MKDSTEQTDTLEATEKAQPSASFLDAEGCGCDSHACSTHASIEGSTFDWKLYWQAGVSFILLALGIGFDFFDSSWFEGVPRFLWFAVAYVLVAYQVVGPAVRNLVKGSIFNEFFLMTIATFGAFYLGEYAEGVAVMLFYTIGEHFQALAVKRSKNSIKNLIDARPDKAFVKRNGVFRAIDPKQVKIGEVIQVKAGEKVVLDGALLSGPAEFNTAALTGESVPRVYEKGDKVLSGMINLSGLIELQVASRFEDSALSRILYLVEQAGSRKATTQKFISKFAKVYTPIVVFLALGLLLVPMLIVAEYDFQEWLYRALVFLVISCPCALVISIPLGYFGGLGAGAQNGILFKGANYLDVLAKVDTIVFDKTGTLTEGKLRLTGISPTDIDPNVIEKVVALEMASTHPVAKAIAERFSEIDSTTKLEEIREHAGMGLSAFTEEKLLLAGNINLLDKHNIEYPAALKNHPSTLIAIAMDGKYQGHFTFEDEIKPDARQMVGQLKKLGAKRLAMLSGDRSSVAEKVATKLDLSDFHGELLPEEKLKKLEELKSTSSKIAFVGDGINDAPALALADVGIAMGGMGTDAAIETADVVLQDDRLLKIPLAIQIGRKTREIVWQNIGLAFGVKALVLILGGMGIASLWEAVFADVGVALLAILNAVRIQKFYRPKKTTPAK
ncbi:cadmium-translocating P-type ATPase [Litoribacter alkaliphilus]|uniref:P-type Zn(2+) transporter n=1 Tax=Litoribacter ruber TaxID=702568 RepID=A0AAP2CFV5_9BACT|nr:heavy metal translocating P-type ATPase [Litoribacter alkaliphilus]MBS9523262.1 cadmium-translocating P-type ATPase [Litoribacter alkaliphilus]